MKSRNGSAPTTHTWLGILGSAYSLFDDLEARGFGKPPFFLGGGTMLMLDLEHRLSKDIDLFAYDVQWLTLLTPRLNDKAASLAIDYVEQANSLKIVMPAGDIDFIVAADVTAQSKVPRMLAGREIMVDPCSEILAKKLFYRAATLKARDVYDMAVAIDLAPRDAAEAAKAANSKRTPLLRRLDELAVMGEALLQREILPYDGRLKHTSGMVEKVRDFFTEQMSEVEQ